MVAKKKTVASKTSKKKAVARKAPTRKKVAPKKTDSAKAAKKTAKKAVAKKVSAKKTVAKKTAVKKASGAKPSAKKKAAAKPAAKRSTPSKPAPKKAVAATKPASKGKLIIKRKSNGNGALAKKSDKKRARKLTSKQLRDFRQMLVVMRDQLAGQVTSLRGDSLQRHDEVNTSEDGTDAFERQFALKLASTESDAIYEIDDALRRISQGTFGICEMSGDPIEIERLRAIPFTRHSLAAQSEIESRRGPHRQSAVRRGLA